MSGVSYGSSWVRYLFDNAPHGVRNLITSAYGWKAARKRFGSAFRHATLELERSQWWPTEEAIGRSREEVARFLEWATNAVPRLRGLQPTPFVDAANGWPILRKSELRRASAAFTAPPGPTPTLERHTSGTTGTPLHFRITHDAFQREYAFAWQHRSWHGCSRRSRTATLAGHPVVPTRQKSPPFWVRNHAENQLIFSSYHMSPGNLHHYAAELARYEPDLVHGYPSSVSLVAAAILDAGVTVRPRAVITASETLLPHQRHVISEAFGIEPRIWYGNTELAGNIVECPQGRLHNREDHSFVEFLDDDDLPAEPGVPARLVVTAWGNRATALVRYDTEDVVVLSPESVCPCGRGGRLVERIVGRVEDFVVDSAGRLLGRLDHLFKDAHGVREAQLVQYKAGAVTIRIVADGPPGPELEAPIRAEAALRFAPGTALSFEYADQLEKTASGKTKFIVSHIKGQPGA